LVLAISIGVIPNLSQPAQEQFAAPVPVATSSEAPVEDVTSETTQASEEAIPVEQAPADSDSESAVQPVEESQAITAATVSVTNTSTATEPSQDAATEARDEQNPFAETMNILLGDSAVRSLGSATATAASSQTLESFGTLVLTNSSGLSVSVAYDLGSERGIQHTWITIKHKKKEFVAVPKVSHAEKTVNLDGTTTLRYLATDLLIGDSSGSYNFVASDASELSRSGLGIVLVASATGEILSSELVLTPRS
jgi:hypothetical protein